MDGSSAAKSAEVLKQLEDLGVIRGELVRIAKRGQLDKVQCEMPTCYCPGGRSEFKTRSKPMHDWALNADHYQRLKKDGGKLTPGNIRLAHVLCNRADYSWRTRICSMLDEGLSLAVIADELNKRNVKAPHGTNRWTAQSVRKAYVS